MLKTTLLLLALVQIAASSVEVGDALRRIGVLNGPLPVLDWLHKSGPFAIQAVLNGTAVVLKNTKVNDWPAMKLWSPAYLEEHAPVMLENVRESETTTMRYSRSAKDSAFFADLPDVIADYSPLTFEYKTMKTSAFMSSTTGERNGKVRYYSDGLEDLSPGLMEDVSPLDLVPNGLPETPRKTQVWIGPKGTVTHCHYDIQENFFVQVYGRKKFLVFPPSSWKYLYPYPFLHPGAQQSQVDLSDPDMTTFPLLSNAQIFEADVGPGDVLYLPPLWGHHVVAEEASASVNVWTPSEKHLMSGVSLPWGAGLTLPCRALAARLFLDEFFVAIFGDHEKGKAFVEALVTFRYAPVVTRVPGLENRGDDGARTYCVDDLSDMSEDVFDDLWSEWDAVDDEWVACTAKDMLEQNEEEWQNAATELADQFLAVEDQGSREELLGNMLEVFARMAVAGDSRAVYPFLADYSRC